MADFVVVLLVESIMWPLLLVPLGLYIGYVGLRKYQTSQLIANTPTQKARSVAGGRAELEGKAVPANGTVPKPLSDGDCVYGQYEVQERRIIRIPTGKNRKSMRIPVWVTVGRGDIGQPFYIEDDTGRVPVDPSDLDLLVENGTGTRTARTDERTPPDVQQFEEHHDIDGDNKGFIERTKDDFHPTNISVRTLLKYWAYVSSPFLNLFMSLGLFSRQRRRYVERYIEPGEEIYVFGNAREQENKAADAIETEDRLLITKDEMTNRFVVSDSGTEDTTVQTLRRQAPVWLASGGILNVFGVYLLVTGLL
ncbi:E3 ubiquitin ligase family protein [Natranaeroarchaeum aerophilus]|uniref:E3 ubiquitin ligase family protein n=1 Tax=Natranaeroarchaeum aerophilus TaxID=2917711 RepID=A0AAE3K5V6_9EURY|nr:E3 ubiquitin ligase family protein [Natranaeroarchaeum aerophilus]MCL9814348.1 E3 ubiquitin ligase family protein [Natranaeroarchaeum aerophilus]